ncbi:Protein GAT2 [Ogataea parapolymorpha DL-1]|uniref:Protein GAT2 n=1 Tax=Ogataea parapolymorpha (strain ATCC 26012 / BCRC 20466 / JCM 22074 / NRRL Y-7560 / DL-1) TaxID=871575 RepID=W1QKF9_OGAPD|nr:Protein GAT2 [Ogataea parapolymorpha DL-1]ESX03638.1 Protein GAT2 [Ogataea parapolymorpha DL-1]
MQKRDPNHFNVKLPSFDELTKTFPKQDPPGPPEAPGTFHRRLPSLQTDFYPSFQQMHLRSGSDVGYLAQGTSAANFAVPPPASTTSSLEPSPLGPPGPPSAVSYSNPPSAEYIVPEQFRFPAVDPNQEFADRLRGAQQNMNELNQFMHPLTQATTLNQLPPLSELEIDRAIRNTDQMRIFLQYIRGQRSRKFAVRSEPESIHRTTAYQDTAKTKVQAHRPTKSEPSIMGESALLRVHPPKPLIVSETDTDQMPKFVPQGTLQQELSVKPRTRCLHCGSINTPEWRKGPNGTRTLCNACGLFHSKLVKKRGLQEAEIIMKRRRETGKSTDRRINE